MILWIASSNKGKVGEFKKLLQNLGPSNLTPPSWEVHSQSELSTYFSPPETGDSFEANARLKAKSLHGVKKDSWVMADDSGLEVCSLNNLPGIYSARYAGEKATDLENNMKVLKMLNLRCPHKRQAKFRCVIVAYSPNGQEYLTEGILNGEISETMKGKGGFGYDSVFIPEGHNQTLAELGSLVKNKISHRHQAFNQLMADLI